MKKQEIKKYLLQGKKVGNEAMEKNGDFIYLSSDGFTVVRSWGGGEDTIGDKYFTWEIKNDWKILDGGKK